MESFDFIYDFPNPVVVFTHGDCDGLCAAAEIIRAFISRKMEYEIVITQPFSLHSDILRFDNQYNFIIVDLAMNSRVLDLIYPGTLVIDHHSTTEDLIGALKARGVFVLYDKTKSASQLVYGVAGKTREDHYLSQLGAAGDWRINNKELGKQSTVLASSLSLISDDDWMRLYVLANLVEGKKVWQMKEVTKRSTEAWKRFDKIKEQYDTIFENDTFVVRLYPNGFGFASILASKLFQETKKTSFIACYLDSKSSDLLITGRTSEKTDFDLGKVFKNFYEWGGYGGGHKKASSGVIPEEKLVSFYKLLRQFTEG